MILTFLLVVAIATLAVLVYRRRHTLTVVDRAEDLDAHQPTEKEIEQAFRETEAPQRRPYRGGEFGTDMAGRKFIADANGALRRVAVVETENGETIMAARKISKAQRKERKRAKQATRAEIEASIDRVLEKIRLGLAARGADPDLISRINVQVNDWHDLGRRILTAAATSTSSRFVWRPDGGAVPDHFEYAVDHQLPAPTGDLR
jgi:hypothetical protein